MKKRKNKNYNECYNECPKCKKNTLKAKWSGVECTNPECDYWFCF